MGELLEEAQVLDALPTWVPTYLAAWGSTRPDGKRMSVVWAAGLAGVSDSAVRDLRARSRQFRMLEHVARRGGPEFMASYAQAGVRAMAPAILQSFRRLVDEGNARIVSEGMRILLGQSGLDVNLHSDEPLTLEMVWGDYADNEGDAAGAAPQSAPGVGR